MKPKEKYSSDSLLSALPDPPEGKKGWPWTDETDRKIFNGLSSFPRISIVTPSYNQGMYIEQTIRSVLLQNYPDLEYIIIDGGSSDNTVEIIKKYEPWLKYWVSEKDHGQTNAINKGILKCDGEIFNWLNSDDYYSKGCFKYLAENFEDKNTDIVAGKYRFFFENENKEKVIELKLRNTIEESIALVAMNQPSTFFRLPVLRLLGKLDENLNYLMDQDIWKKYLFKFGQDKIKIINNVLVSFRYHPDSKTSQFNFINEYFGIFYSIAEKAGMPKHLEVLKTIYGEDIIFGYSFSFSFSKDKIKLARKVINSLFLFNARTAFTEKNISQLKLWLSVIENKLLNEKQRNDLLILKVKANLIKFKLGPVISMINRRNNSSKSKLKPTDSVKSI